jgi:hypothetical protein
MTELEPEDAQPYQPRAWRCPVDPITAEARHPVQVVHISLGQEDEQDGRHRRVIAKDIIGAELIVFHEILAD